MDESSVAQARGRLRVISGGYGRNGNGEFIPNPPDGVEYIDWDKQYDDWVRIPEGHGAITTWYLYSDSNSARNSQSTRVKVYITNEYDISYDSQNNMVLDVATRVDKIERAQYRGNAAIPSGAGRSIFLYAPDAPNKVLWSVRNDNVNTSHTINVNYTLPKRTGIVLAPGQSTNLGTVLYWNVVTGYEPYLGRPSIYTDAMEMGLVFQNNMPTELEPPVLLDVVQVPDICENYVDSVMTFKGPIISGVKLHLEWGYESEPVNAHVVEMDGSKGVNLDVILYQLAPTNHTDRPRSIKWRAKWMPTTAKIKESEWSEGTYQIMFILHPHETVPDISGLECSAISKGELLPRYESEVCYSEDACADLPNVRDKLLARLKEKNKDCRIMNGVATAEDLKEDN